VDEEREVTQRPHFSAANGPICAVRPMARLPFRPRRLLSYALHRRCRTRRKEISLVTIPRAARGPTLAASGPKIHAACSAQADAIR
jgi:hypothetical protein